MSGNNPVDYIYFNGSRLARIISGTPYYYFEDHLQSARVNVQAGQDAACYEADFEPYGTEHVVTNTCTHHYKFTRKERDSETGNDYFGARFHESNLGRFMSPDPANVGAHTGDPQTWNAYAYVRNSPTTLTDPSGLYGLILDYAWDWLGPASGGSVVDEYGSGGRTPKHDPTRDGQSKPHDDGKSSAEKTQNKETVVFSDRANAPPDQRKPGAAADRTVDYQAGKMDKKGNIDSHDILRDAKLTLHEKLDPNSKNKSNIIADKPQTQTGIFKDYQFVPAGGAFRVLRNWDVNGEPARVLDTTTHSAYRYEVITDDANAKPPIKTEYTNEPPF